MFISSSAIAYTSRDEHYCIFDGDARIVWNSRLSDCDTTHRDPSQLPDVAQGYSGAGADRDGEQSRSREVSTEQLLMRQTFQPERQTEAMIQVCHVLKM